MATTTQNVEDVLNFRKPNQFPAIEWVDYWTETRDRWHDEGLDRALNNLEVQEFFGLDPHIRLGTQPMSVDYPKVDYGHGAVSSAEDYRKILNYLYPRPAVAPKRLEYAALMQQQKGASVCLNVNGFFWFPRDLFGIEDHLYAFYDNPGLMNEMNKHNLEFIMRLIDEVLTFFTPQFISVGEDMSYKDGPMISKGTFDEFLKPFYLQLLPFIKSKNIKVFVDSDGLVDQPVDWYKSVGFDGFMPMERQAGVDISEYRKKHPDLLIIGGFDKRCISKGEGAMRQEFERLFPIMQQGGYVPCVDHQTPPDASIENYRLYVKLLREYGQQAMIA